jgi:hypothetical protein
VVSNVDSFHTLDWHKDAQRKPQALPDVFALCLWLLVYLPCSEDSDLKARCRVYVEQVVGSVEEMVRGVWAVV